MTESRRRDPLDTAIDGVVERMTAGDAGPAFRERVLSRIERRPRWRAAALVPLAAAGAAAVLLVSLLTGGTAPGTSNVPPKQPVATHEPPPAPRPGPEPAGAAAGVHAEPRRVPETRRDLALTVGSHAVPGAGAGDEAPAERVVQLAGLPPLAPIALTPILSGAVQPEEITMSPIELDPLVVNPLVTQPAVAAEE
jgi:hypothetical protein